MKNFLLTTAVCIASISGYAQGSYRQGFALDTPAPVTLVKRWVGALAVVSAVSFAGIRLYQAKKEADRIKQQALEAQEALKLKQQDAVNLVADMSIVRILENYEADQLAWKVKNRHDRTQAVMEAKLEQQALDVEQRGQEIERIKQENKVLQEAVSRHTQAEAERKAALARQESEKVERERRELLEIRRLEQLEKEKQLLQEALERQNKEAEMKVERAQQALEAERRDREIERMRQLEFQKEVIQRRKEQDKVERIARVFADMRESQRRKEIEQLQRENTAMWGRASVYDKLSDLLQRNNILAPATT